MSDDHLLGLGDIAKLEKKIRDYYGMKYCLTVANATIGLLATEKAGKLTGAEAVVAPLGWGGTLAGFLHLGGRVRFADVDPATLALCVRSASHRIGGRTRAIIAADLFGVPADSRALRTLADERGLFYLHDAAQGFPGQREGKPAGAFAHAVILSFGPAKFVTGMEGGAIVTNSVRLYEELIWLTQHPLRQKRELGLARRNEFALNARIHPNAATLVLRNWRGAHMKLASRCTAANAIVSQLVDAHLISDPDYRQTGIAPAFHELSLIRRPSVSRKRFSEQLRQIAPELSATPLSLVPFYRQRAFPRGAGIGQVKCDEVEAQLVRRINITGWISRSPA